MSIPTLNDKSYTPAVCLHEVLENVDEIESVVVLIKYKDHTAQTYASWMPMPMMAYLAKVFDRRIHNLIGESAE